MQSIHQRFGFHERLGRYRLPAKKLLPQACDIAFILHECFSLVPNELNWQRSRLQAIEESNHIVVML